MVDETQIRKILREIRTLAVVGCSKVPAKDAHRVPKYMQMDGYRIIPVTPTATAIRGETAYPTLCAAARRAAAMSASISPRMLTAAGGASNFAVVTASDHARRRDSGTTPTRNGWDTPRSILTVGLIPANVCTGTSIQLDPSWGN